MSRNSYIVFRASDEEIEWVQHAAKLKNLTVSEYIKEAVNTRLRKEGVDAVLFKVKSDT